MSSILSWRKRVNRICHKFNVLVYQTTCRPVLLKAEAQVRTLLLLRECPEEDWLKRDFLVLRKTQCVALCHVPAYRTVRGPLATLVVTRSTHDYVESENRGDASTRIAVIRLGREYY